MNSEKEVNSVPPLGDLNVDELLQPPFVPSLSGDLTGAIPHSVARTGSLSKAKKCCRHCGSMNIERTRRAGWEKIILPIARSYRYICYACGKDFFSRRSVPLSNGATSNAA